VVVVGCGVCETPELWCFAGVHAWRMWRRKPVPVRACRYAGAGAGVAENTASRSDAGIGGFSCARVCVPFSFSLLFEDDGQERGS